MNKQQFATQSADLQVHADAARQETLHGEDHLVAPATLVREMVLKGELLPFEEIERTALAWNGSPVTIAHPRDDDGDFLPASQGAEAYERHAVGQLFNVQADPNDRALVGEVWLNTSRTSASAEDLDRDDPAAMLEDGEGPIEVSTGYWYRRNDESGEYDGEEYNAVQADVQPDHLATLPNSQGECSLDDGCGLARPDAAAATAAVANDDPDAPASPGRLVDSIQHGIERLASFAAHSSDDADDPSAACNCGDDPDACSCGAGDDDGDGDGDGPVAGNQDVGDAVRWESDASAAIGGYRYGVVVDALQDGPDDQVLVAVYEPTDDGWQNRDEQNPMNTDRLEVVGSDGVGSLPPIDQLGGQVQDDTPTTDAVVAIQTDSGFMAYDLNEISSASGLSVATLEDMDDDELATVAETFLQDDDGNDGDGGNDGGDGGDGGDGDDPQAAQSTDAVQDLREEIQRLEGMLEEQAAGASREELTAEIQRHADVSDDSLAAMSTSELADLRDQVTPTRGVHVGRRGTASNADSDEPAPGASLADMGGDA